MMASFASPGADVGQDVDASRSACFHVRRHRRGTRAGVGAHRKARSSRAKGTFFGHELALPGITAPVSHRATALRLSASRAPVWNPFSLPSVGRGALPTDGTRHGDGGRGRLAFSSMTKSSDLRSLTAAARSVAP